MSLTHKETPLNGGSWVQSWCPADGRRGGRAGCAARAAAHVKNTEVPPVTPPSIAIEAPVLGGPLSVRVCVSQQQQRTVTKPWLTSAPLNNMPHRAVYSVDDVTTTATLEVWRDKLSREEKCAPPPRSRLFHVWHCVRLLAAPPCSSAGLPIFTQVQGRVASPFRR